MRLGAVRPGWLEESSSPERPCWSRLFRAFPDPCLLAPLLWGPRGCPGSWWLARPCPAQPCPHLPAQVGPRGPGASPQRSCFQNSQASGATFLPQHFLAVQQRARAGQWAHLGRYVDTPARAAPACPAAPFRPPGLWSLQALGKAALGPADSPHPEPAHGILAFASSRLSPPWDLLPAAVSRYGGPRATQSYLQTPSRPCRGITWSIHFLSSTNRMPSLMLPPRYKGLFLGSGSPHPRESVIHSMRTPC